MNKLQREDILWQTVCVQGSCHSLHPSMEPTYSPTCTAVPPYLNREGLLLLVQGAPLLDSTSSLPTKEPQSVSSFVFNILLFSTSSLGHLNLLYWLLLTTQSSLGPCHPLPNSPWFAWSPCYLPSLAHLQSISYLTYLAEFFIKVTSDHLLTLAFLSFVIFVTKDTSLPFWNLPSSASVTPYSCFPSHLSGHSNVAIPSAYSHEIKSRLLLGRKAMQLRKAVTIWSDFGAPQNKVSHCFHCFPICLPWSDQTRCHDLSFLNVES